MEFFSFHISHSLSSRWKKSLWVILLPMMRHWSLLKHQKQNINGIIANCRENQNKLHVESDADHVLNLKRNNINWFHAKWADNKLRHIAKRFFISNTEQMVWNVVLPHNSRLHSVATVELHSMFWLRQTALT